MTKLFDNVDCQRIRQGSKLLELIEKRREELYKRIEGKDDIEWARDSSLGEADKEITVLEKLLRESKNG